MSATISDAALRYARIALGTAFLSAVASRFGLWQGTPGLSRFPAFIAHTGQVNAFMPAVTIPFLAWAATFLEVACGLGLVLFGLLPARIVAVSVWPRILAFASAVLLLLFALAMTISLGPKQPLDYSVFSASACALLLAIYPVSPSSPA
ncbi:MAG TPA: DoxX protein [Edaphobacter sp.]|nr:DoxX protein [Edaphobacter sp.]